MTHWTTTPITTDLVRGALDLVATDRGLLPQRLPAWARAQLPDEATAEAVARPAGVRLALRTSATQLEVDVVRTRTTTATPAGPGPLAPDGVYDLLVDGVLLARSTASGGDVVEVDPVTGAAGLRRGPVGTVRFRHLPPGEKDVEVWLPHTEITTLVALRADAPTAASPVPAARRTWVHHGGATGAGADSPSATWTALAAALGGVELVDLGFDGAAHLDPFTARALRSAPADVISLEVGRDVVAADTLRRRAFGPALHGFLDTVREGHPDVPLLVVSPLGDPDLEELPAATRAHDDAAGRLSLRTCREVVAEVLGQRAADDPRLFLLDGLDLHDPAAQGADGAPFDHQLSDALDHHRVAERFARGLFVPGAPFAA